MNQFSRKKLTGLLISGIALPVASDREIQVTLAPISAAGDLRRTVNADLVNLTRDVFQKFAVGISGSDLWSAGLAGVMPGQYAEVSPPAHMTVTASPASALVQLPRAGFDVYGLTNDGRRVQPISQPEDPRPLSPVLNAERVASLRVKPVVEFSEPVEAVRFRAVLACAVVSWSSDADERQATASWSMQLEEI